MQIIFDKTDIVFTISVLIELSKCLKLTIIDLYLVAHSTIMTVL